MCYGSLVETSLLSVFFFSSRRRHTRFSRDWSSDVCSSDLQQRSFRDAEAPPRRGSPAGLQAVWHAAPTGRAASTRSRVGGPRGTSRGSGVVAVRLLFAEHLFVQGLDARVGFGRERLLPGDLAGLVPDLHPVPRALLRLLVAHGVSCPPVAVGRASL